MHSLGICWACFKMTTTFASRPRKDQCQTACEKWSLLRILFTGSPPFTSHRTQCVLKAPTAPVLASKVDFSLTYLNRGQLYVLTVSRPNKPFPLQASSCLPLPCPLIPLGSPTFSHSVYWEWSLRSWDCAIARPSCGSVGVKVILDSGL